MGAEARQVVQAVVGAARSLAVGFEEGRGESDVAASHSHKLNLSPAGTRERRNVGLLPVQL